VCGKILWRRRTTSSAVIPDLHQPLFPVFNRHSRAGGNPEEYVHLLSFTLMGRLRGNNENGVTHQVNCMPFADQISYSHAGTVPCQNAVILPI